MTVYWLLGARNHQTKTLKTSERRFGCLIGCVYTSPDRSGNPDVPAPDSPSVYTKSYPEQYATLSGAVWERFQRNQRWIIRMSRCSSDTCKRGIRISGCHCACALRFPSTESCSLFFPLASKLSFALFLSCNRTIWFKSFPHSFGKLESHFTCIVRTNFQYIHAI